MKVTHDHDGSKKMQPQKQQWQQQLGPPTPKSEREEQPEIGSCNDPEYGDDGCSRTKQNEGGRRESNTEGMNSDEASTYSNRVPRERHDSGEERRKEWPPLHNSRQQQRAGVAASPSSLYSPGARIDDPFPGFSFSAASASPGSEGGFSEMIAGFGAAREATTASLTMQERATDASYPASYAMQLASKGRTEMSTASVDGKIQEPHFNDILCGRGGSINSHPGNRIFRGWIAERRESYNLAESKADKSRITSEIMEKVQDQGPPGRFLQKFIDKDNKRGQHESDRYGFAISTAGHWFEIDDAKALAKISQALREGAPAFRAAHGKKARAGASSKSKRKGGSRRRGSRHKKEEEEHELSPGAKRKSPPRMEEATTRGGTMEVVRMQEVELTPPFPERRVVTRGGAAVPPLPSNGRDQLDVLFPTNNNIFATENYRADSGDNDLLNSYPLVHMGDYNASIDEVARAVPPTPVATQNPQRPSTPPSVGTEPGMCTTPSYPQTPNGAVNMNMVSPGFSPYGAAKAAWDAITFMPNLGPSDHSPIHKKPKMRTAQQHQRVHSLSFSDGCSLGSFDNPFENDDRRELTKSREPEPEEEADRAARGPSTEVFNTFPPPLPSPWVQDRARNPAPPHGLSFGRIGGIPGEGGNSNNNNNNNRNQRLHRHQRSSGNNNHNNNHRQRHRLSSRRESSISSKSWGSSVSNLHNSKRKSIA